MIRLFAVVRKGAARTNDALGMWLSSASLISGPRHQGHFVFRSREDAEATMFADPRARSAWEIVELIGGCDDDPGNDC